MANKDDQPVSSPSASAGASITQRRLSECTPYGVARCADPLVSMFLLDQFLTTLAAPSELVHCQRRRIGSTMIKRRPWRLRIVRWR